MNNYEGVDLYERKDGRKYTFSENHFRHVAINHVWNSNNRYSRWKSHSSREKRKNPVEVMLTRKTRGDHFSSF